MNASTNENPAKPSQNNLFSRFWGWFRRSEKTAFLRNWKSPFYFFLFVFVLGMLWCIYGIVENEFSSAYNWDYSHQYLPFAQSYHDTWRHFFATGEFRLYDTVTFIGADNIGSNAYYGLFDPFTIFITIFPRSAVPQMYLICTLIKLTLCAYFSRKFLKYRGISEGASRFGAIAIAFSGYLNFMVGFPTFVSALTYVPLILYGIEKVLKEKKIVALALGIFLMMLSCFLLTVTMCIWGVLYAMFRFFVTIKSRNAKDNVIVVLAGILGFAVGIMMSAWILIPSFRASSSTGRTVSIGNAYMHALLDAIKAADFKEAFRLLFLEVGENPSRELMALVSFIFPTGGFQSLPIMRYDEGFSYDAWTASIFCYTPFIVLFFQGVIFSIRQKKVSHILGILGIVFLLFTTFAYYFFFGFSGNGYGRWYFVLVPTIVHYGCWAFDQRKTSPRWIPIVGAILALAVTILSYYAIYWVLENVRVYGDTYTTYYPSTFLMPDGILNYGETYIRVYRSWYLVYECALIVVEGIILLVGYRKKWLTHAFVILIAAEAVAMGNTSYFYVGLWSLEYSYMVNANNLADTRYMAERIDESAKDEAFYRVNFANAGGTVNFQYAAGEPASSSFHSLLNYADAEFAYLNTMMNLPSTSSKHSYGDTPITSYSWSASYRNKRYATDQALGYRYYVEGNYPTENVTNKVWIGENVPFGAEELVDASPDRYNYRVYRVPESEMPSLGHAVDPTLIYSMNKTSEYSSDFYGSFSRTARNIHKNNLRNHVILTSGAIVDDDVTLPKGFVAQEAPDLSNNIFFDIPVLSYKSGFKADVYTTKSGDFLFPSPANAVKYGDSSVGYFFSNYDKVYTLENHPDLLNGKDHLVIYPSSGTYFNNDERGAYFLITKTWPDSVRNRDKKNFLRQPRVIFFGDDNKVLGYDCSTFGVVAADGEMTSYYSGYSGSCGFYASGKVRNILIIWPTNTDITTAVRTSDFTISVFPYSEIEARNKWNQETKLQDVKKIKNGYTFRTDYADTMIVSTQLGYDDGWTVYAKGEDGKKTKLSNIRISGGLQGFVAPGGETEYEMVYVTPGLNMSVVVSIAGVVLCGGYSILMFVLSVRKSKKELALLAERETPTSL